MKESDYIVISNLTRLRIAERILRDVMLPPGPDKDAKLKEAIKLVDELTRMLEKASK